MRIKLPREMRGASVPRVTAIEFNDFDIDLFLPSLFFRLLSEGKGRARKVNESTAISTYVEKLAHHIDVEGFDDESGSRLMHRLVRTSLAITGWRGQRRTGEQILAVLPYSVLSHKTGLPSESSRQRNVDTFLYGVLSERFGTDESLHGFLTQVFGKGVVLGRRPVLGGHFDGTTELDTLTRLSLAFLDGFEPTAVGRDLGRARSEACPGLIRELGWDLQHYLYAFHDRMPPQALTYYLLGLINFELFTYSLKLVHGINELVRDPSALPPALASTAVRSDPGIYLDFTAQPGNLSQQMAIACVRRDIDAYGQFLPSLLTLRQLDRYVDGFLRNPNYRGPLQHVLDAREASAPNYLQALLLMPHDRTLGFAIDARADADEVAIRKENERAALDEDQLEDDVEWLDALLPGHLTPLQRIVTLLTLSQSRMREHFVKWYWGVGGLVKPHGLLAGTLRGRRAWRYQPSNDLLAILVQLASIRPGPDGETTDQPRPVRLREFLDFLEERFGILVDRPPAPFSGAEVTAAARENLVAMLRRLRQMGVFRDLSDDFTVQELTPPYAGVEATA